MSRTPQSNTPHPHESEPDLVPDYPSYVYAKVGHLPPDQPPPEAHLARNEWQACLAPPTLPDTLPYHDPQTDLTWVQDAVLGEVMFHGGQDCIRAVIDGPRLDALRSDPDYRQALAEVAGSHGVDADQLVPSAQVCYSADTGEASDGGSTVGTWDFASPDVPGQSWAHVELDVMPDHWNDAYVNVPVASNDPACDVSGVGSAGGLDSGGASNSAGDWGGNGGLDGGGGGDGGGGVSEGAPD